MDMAVTKRGVKGQETNHFLRALLTIAVLLVAPLASAFATQPITTDSRIKTFVYNANEVFNVTTHYGYQSNIEFGARESIETVSLGDRVGWQIIPSGRRLFIRAMEENAHTNMTVITNQRAYQFDLRSSDADAVFGSEELTYVVRFFYPEDLAAGASIPVTYVRDATPATTLPPVTLTPPPARTAPAAPSSPAPRVSSAPAVIAPPAPTPASSPVNYRYTYSGPNEIAPIKIYDDGRTTYFKFARDMAPRVAVVTAKGESLSVPSRRTADGLVAVDVIAPRFALEQSGQQVMVYNEADGVM